LQKEQFFYHIHRRFSLGFIDLQYQALSTILLQLYLEDHPGTFEE
jgi:hypothetical protein